jgi:surface protein
MKETIVIRNRNHLMKVIYEEIEQNGNQCDLNHLDIFNVTNLENLFFFNNTFAGDISRWDVSHITNMKQMFYKSSFNGDISKWDVSKVENMDYMFQESSFKGDLSDWKPYIVKDSKSPFTRTTTPMPYWARIENQSFREEEINFYHLRKLIIREIELNGENCNLNHIDISKINTLKGLFKDLKFNGNISNWDVSHVTEMDNLFENSTFKGDLSNWTPYSLISVHNIFNGSSAPIPYWAEIQDYDARKKAIDSYLLSKTLNQELNKNNEIKKKIKI